MGGRDAAADGLSAALRALPSVERLAAAHRRAARAGGRRGAGGHRGAARRPAGRRGRGWIRHRRAGAGQARRGPGAVPAARDQRHRRHRPHEPRPGAARGSRPRGRRAPRRRATRTSSSTSASGERGSRQAHVEELLRELTGAQAALAVNNGAGAVLLAAAALAAGRGLVVSRGQLVEIGGAFRIPDVVGQSGARLVEVGTTNRTRRSDYERALAALAPGEQGVVLRVHASNFRTLGFTEEVAIEELCALGVPVIDDVGSGRLDDDLAALADEPSVRRSVAAGAALVCFSGDKLLGGPQAGLLVGRAESVARARAHPLARALRIDKLSLAALEATLRLYREPARARRELPVLAMLDATEEELAGRAERLRASLAEAGVAAEVRDAVARVGGGALPLLELRGPAVALDPAALGAEELARRLRVGEPPVVARIERGRVLLDPRTMTDDDAEGARAGVVAALR